MTQRAEFDMFELHLTRVLNTVITERSVARAALNLNRTQPTVSVPLKTLRALIGDPLLVRACHGMTPTERALQLAGPAAGLPREAERRFSERARSTAFDPVTA